MTQYLQVKSHVDGRWYWIALGPPLHLVEQQADATPLGDDVLVLIREIWRIASSQDETRIRIVGVAP